jgi:hypothetical protein
MYEDEIDGDEYRNATVVHEHAGGQPARVVTVAPVRPIGPQYPAPYGYPAYPAAAYPPAPGYPYGYPPPAPSPWSTAKSLKAIGLIVDVAAGALAAFMPLPGAPTPTGDPTKDTENLTLYQTALASHAKVDERIRTVAKAIRDALVLKAHP